MEDEHGRPKGSLTLIAIFGLPFLIALVAFVSFRFFGANDIENEVIVSGARDVTALAPLSDGGFVYGERLTGKVFRTGAEGGNEGEPLAQIEVTTEGQRGLLGLAADRDGNIFASYTDAQGFITVAELVSSEENGLREVWTGPQSQRASNGGHLAFDPDGELVLGIGDLLQPELIPDPAQLNGKILALDPDGDASQLPRIISGGWNNPVAFTFTPGGDLWVADTAPGDRSERIARGDMIEGPARVTALRDRKVPAGLAAPDDETLVLCSFADRDLGIYKIDARGVAYTLDRFPTLATDCGLGVIVLEDGRLVYSTGEDLRIAPAP